MSKTLLDDNDHWIATEGEGGAVLRVVDKKLRAMSVLADDFGHATVPIDKLRTALRRATGPRQSWDGFFLDIAALVASRSKDPSTKVGAVIIDQARRIVSTGYNGFARGVHAEANAVLFARRDLTGCTIYIWPSPPCAACASVLIQSGIKLVLCPPTSADMLSRWGKVLALAEDILDEAGVLMEHVGEAVEP